MRRSESFTARRQPDPDGEAGRRRTVGKLDIAVMRQDNFAHDRKTKARSLALGADQAIEALEYPLPFSRRNARPVVLDGKDDPARIAAELGGHVSADRRMAQGVLDQIGDKLAQQHRVAKHDMRSSIILEAKIDIAGKGGVDETFDRIARDLRKLDVFPAERCTALFRARERQELAR